MKRSSIVLNLLVFLSTTDGGNTWREDRFKKGDKTNAWAVTFNGDLIKVENY